MIVDENLTALLLTPGPVSLQYIEYGESVTAVVFSKNSLCTVSAQAFLIFCFIILL